VTRRGLAVALTAGLLALASTLPAAAAPADAERAVDGGGSVVPNGSYAGPITLKSGPNPGRVVLERIAVTSTDVTVHLRLVNTMPKKLQMACPAREGADSEVVIISAAGQDVRPARTFCTEHAGQKRAVNVGADLPITATFRAARWQDVVFGFLWYGYSAGAMRLHAGEIEAVAPPAGSRLGDNRSAQARLLDRIGGVGLLIILVLLLALGLWWRRWYLSGRPDAAPRPAKQGYRLPANHRKDDDYLVPSHRVDHAEGPYDRPEPAPTRRFPAPGDTGDNVIGFPRRGRRRLDDDRR
jgi:hypothetical protein